MAIIICPVAGCGKEIPTNSHSKGYKHFQDQDDFHKTLHFNFLSYFYPDLAKSDYTDDLKFRFAYQRWHKQEKDQAKMPKHDKQEGDNITMKDGKIVYNNEEYTPEQFSQMQKGVKYLPLEHR